MAVDAHYVYWANLGTNTIARANLDGTGVNENFITGANAPVGVAVDAHYVYWANFVSNTIARANLDGTGAIQDFISGAPMSLTQGWGSTPPMFTGSTPAPSPPAATRLRGQTSTARA